MERKVDWQSQTEKLHLFALKPVGDITITITITIVQKPLKTFARKSEKEERIVGWKRRTRKAGWGLQCHSSDRGAAAFICYLFYHLQFTI